MDFRSVLFRSIIIDAMVGIGIKGVLREPVSTIVTMINEEPAYIISVDIPSGLPADEGESNFKSVQADYTVIIGAPKISAFLQQDRKSTRLNSSHVAISYAVFCL